MTREYPSAPLIAVGVVVHRDTQILLIKRAKPPNKGQWSLPGGAQDLGETVFEAAKRETLEETSLQTQNHELIDVVDSIHRSADGRVQYHYSILEISCDFAAGAVAAGDDADDARWFERKDLSSLDLPHGTLAIVEKSFELFDQRSRKASFTDE